MLNSVEESLEPLLTGCQTNRDNWMLLADQNDQKHSTTTTAEEAPGSQSPTLNAEKIKENCAVSKTDEIKSLEDKHTNSNHDSKMLKDTSDDNTRSSTGCQIIVNESNDEPTKHNTQIIANSTDEININSNNHRIDCGASRVTEAGDHMQTSRGPDCEGSRSIKSRKERKTTHCRNIIIPKSLNCSGIYQQDNVREKRTTKQNSIKASPNINQNPINTTGILICIPFIKYLYVF